MDRMEEERLTYREWLERQKEATAAARSFGGSDESRPRYDATGHPLDEPLPQTGDAAYDARRPRRQAHSPAAREAAGFNERQLQRVRDALDAGESPELPEDWTVSSPQ
jgi:hypothetical protein